MTSIGISFVTKKDIPLVGMMNVPQSEEDESLERSIYVVEHNENPQVKWGKHNPKINETGDLLD